MEAELRHRAHRQHQIPMVLCTLFDAVSKQLGLKLEKQRRPVQVLVIDHIEEKPTEN